MLFEKKSQVKGTDLQKELPKLLAYGYAKGLFQNLHLVHDLAEWRKFGDAIFQGMIDGEKMAKNYGNWWRVVYNDLLQYLAEKEAAEQASAVQGRNKNYNEWSDCPVPPAVSTIKLPPAAKPALPVAAEPSAPSPSPCTSVSDEPPASTMALQPAPSTPLLQGAAPWGTE